MIELYIGANQMATTSSQLSSSCMHGVLNVDEKKLIAQLGAKSRDETFESN